MEQSYNLFILSFAQVLGEDAFVGSTWRQLGLLCELHLKQGVFQAGIPTGPEEGERWRVARTLYAMPVKED